MDYQDRLVKETPSFSKMQFYLQNIVDHFNNDQWSYEYNNPFVAVWLQDGFSFMHLRGLV